MARWHELEDLRRSLAMLNPRSPGLDREEAMALIAELQRADERLRYLRRELERLVEEMGPTIS